MEKNPKPILVIKMPSRTNQAEILGAQESLKKKGVEDDYHILIVSNGNSKKVDVEVFYDKDIKEIDIEQLKQLIKDGFESKSNQQK